MLSRIIVLSLMLGSVSAYAVNESSIQLGIYQSNITYTEPSVMEEDGTLLGFSARLSYYQKNVFRAVELYYSRGDMDYVGSGTITDIPDEILEVRGLLGSDLELSPYYQIMPYIGFGYRNLNDDSSGMTSSTSASGYEREQIYIYLPIGIEVKQKNSASGWTLSGRAEFDYFIDGINYSYLGDLQGYEDLIFDQDEGYGYRVSVGLTKGLSVGWALTIEPFYRYWNVSESSVTYSVRGTSWIEPDNYSKELGVSLLLSF